jgi:hypothetical protein
MKKADFQKKMDSINHKMSIENRVGSDFNRARSVTVGTAFGGTTEIMMRMNNGKTVWAVMQPVEVVELIHQLAANVGCHLMLKPREDFSSWRNWRVSPEEKKHLNGHPPFVNDMAPFMQIGANMSAPEQKPGLKLPVEARSDKNETVAIEKPKNRRSTKRTAKAA